MNRERFEELLPAYLDGELSAEEVAEMEQALADAPELRASMAQSRALEEALLMRRDEVPPVDQFVTWLAPAAAQRSAERPRAWRVLNAMMSVPALAFMGFVVVGLWAYWHQATIVSLLDRPVGGVILGDRLASMFTIDGLGASINTLTAALTGGDMLVLIAVYSVVTIAILALTGVMTLRFVRN